MKKIVFLMPFYSLPVPSTMGGGVEELLTLLLEEHEKVIEPDTKFYFITKDLYGKTKKQFNSSTKYNNSEIIKIDYLPFFNNFVRATNKILKKLHINKRFTNIYYLKAFKEIQKINPDLIICEREFDVNIEKLAKTFGRDKLSFHIHIQILDKMHLEKYFGSLISVSNFISEDWKAYLEENNNKPDMKYLVLPNCVNEDRFLKQISSQERKKLRTSFGFSDDDFVCVFCGRISEIKGIDKLIEAILQLDEKFKLLIVGSVDAANYRTSPFLTKIMELTKNNPNKIKATGYVKNWELYKFYQLADIQIIPTMCEEAAGLVAIEGQLCGLPQIITRSGGMVEFASDIGTIIINKDDQVVENLKIEIANLESDKKKRQLMAEENKKHGLIFNKNIYYLNFMQLLNELIQNKD